MVAAYVPGAHAASVPQLSWIALGDSYSAGVGHNGGLGLNSCKRQGGTYGGYVDPAVSGFRGRLQLASNQTVLHACIGAKTPDYFSAQSLDGAPDPDPQRDKITSDTDVVTMTFGGNDLNFGDVVFRCIFSGCPDFELSSDDLDALFDKLVAVYLDARSKMASDGHLFVLTYPELFSDPDAWRNATCENLTRNEGKALNRASQRLADTIFQAVQRANEGPRGNVHFVDIIPSFKNKGLCRTDFESFVRGASADRRESFHPSSPGYDAMGNRLAKCMLDVYVYARRCDRVGAGGPPGSTGGVVSALAIDSSGSMTSNDPSRRRIDAAKAFVTASIADDRVSVVDFDSSVFVRASRLSPRAQRLELNAAIDAIDSSGGTNIGAAVQSACNELVGASGSSPRIGVLFTDGQGDYSNEASCFVNNGWPLYTFGLGSGVNGALLQQIADETGGEYKPLADVRNLVCEFQQVRQRLAGGLAVDCNATGTINPGQTIDILQPVAPNTLQQTFTVTRPDLGSSIRATEGNARVPGAASRARVTGGPDIQLTLRSPSGRTITRDTIAGDVTVDVGSTHESIAVERPEAGDWQVSLTGMDVPTGQEYKFSTVGIEDPSNDPPVPDFNAYPGNNGDVALDATASTDRDGEIISYRWYFSDGSSASGSKVSHRFAYDASHSATLVVTDDAFHTEALTKAITIPASQPATGPPPAAPAIASAPATASSNPYPFRAATRRVTAKTTPNKEIFRPYTFTTTGRVVPPPYCTAGAAPKAAGGSCVALKVARCTGVVTVRFKKRTYTISSRNVGLRSDCTYRSKVALRTPNPLRRGTLSVSVRFQGNTVLLPRVASVHSVRSGIGRPGEESIPRSSRSALGRGAPWLRLLHEAG